MCYLNLDELNFKEKSAVQFYKLNNVFNENRDTIRENAAGILNQFLATGKTTDGSTILYPECKEIDEGLQSIFNSDKFQPITKILYRACGIETIAQDAFTTGREFTYPAYMSTSSDKEAIQRHCDSTEQVILQINACDKNGVIPFEYRTNDDAEYEYLINKDSQFKVTRVSEYDHLSDRQFMKEWLPSFRIEKTQKLYILNLDLL
ncbi:TPA: hypothetical protein OT306_001061 [Morganella morganii]|nr:hypothetical protein [Morganella morganii]